MAIVQENYVCKNGVNLTYTYSDKGNYILQKETSVKYAEAYDIPNKYTYLELDEKIEEKEEQ